MKNKTKELALASILTALSVLITYSPLKLVLTFFTLTLGAHVPTMLAIFVGPWVTIMTVIGSCLGFFLTIPAPNSIIVVVRAATHLVFALAGIKMLEKNFNIVVVIVFTAILHAATEGIAVYVLTPIVLDNSTVSLTAGGIAALGTLLHHGIDAAITAPILIALTRAKIIKGRYK